MGLIAPAFLAGLLALGLPLLLHLAERSEREGRRFPSLMFLSRVALRRRRRRGLRDRMLLALRCLALALLALAFSRPFAPDGASGALEPPQDLVVLLDRSYSMGQGERWQRALQAIQSTVASLPAGGRAALVPFDVRAETVQPLTSDHGGLRAVMGQLAPGTSGTDFAAAFAHAAALLATSGSPLRRVLLVSDLQRVGLLEGAPPGLPEGIELEVAGVAGDDGVNVSMEPLSVLAGDEGDRLAVTLRNASDAPQSSLRLELVLDGALIERRGVKVEAGLARLLLPLPAASPEPLRVEARLFGDALEADNRQRLVLPPARPLRVLRVRADDAEISAGLFLERALAVADAPSITLQQVSVSALAGESLEAYDVVLLDDPASLGAAEWRRLRAHAEHGGGLLVVAGERADAGPEARDWLPAWPGAVRDAGVDGGLRVARVGEARHLAATYAPLGVVSPLLMDAGVQRFRSLRPAPDDRVVLQLETAAPLMLARDVGAGVVAILATTLDERWGEWPRSPRYAPLVVSLLRELAARGPVATGFMVGDVLDVVEHAAALGLDDLVAHLRSGGGAIVESGAGDSRALTAEAALVFEQAGFVEVHPGGGARPLPLAVNVDTRESDADLLSAASLRAAVRRLPASGEPARDALRRERAERGDDEAWRWLLALAAAFFIAESWLASRRTRWRPLPGGAR